MIYQRASFAPIENAKAGPRAAHGGGEKASPGVGLALALLIPSSICHVKSDEVGTYQALARPCRRYATALLNHQNAISNTSTHQRWYV